MRAQVSKDHDPVVMGPVKARPEGFTPWEKIEVSGLKTLKELNDYLLEKVQAEVRAEVAASVPMQAQLSTSDLVHPIAPRCTSSTSA